MTFLDAAFERPTGEDTNTNSSQPKSPRVNLTVNPSDEELRIISDLQTLFLNARTAKRDIVARWRRNYRYLRNRMWDNMARPEWMPAPAVPEIFPIVASTVGWMTDQRFKHTISPASLPYSEAYQQAQRLATDLELVMDSSWHVNQEEAEITKMLWDSQIYGIGITKTGWQSTLAGGKGDAITRRVDPFCFYPDPAARSMEDANYFIEVRNMSVQELDRRFPGAGKHFTAGAVTQDIDESPTQTGDTFPRPTHANPAAIPGPIPPATSSRYGLVGQASVSILDDVAVTVFECWVREHYLYEDSESGDVRVMDGWRVIVFAGNNILLNEPAENLWSHGSHPYERYVPNDIGEFWGISLVELLIPSQQSINRILAALQQNVELVGNPVWRETVDSGTGRTRITNKPGTRVTTNRSPNPGADVGWIQPPQVHQMMPELLRFLLQRMEAVSGLSAITKGGAPGGRNSQGVVDAMQEAAFVRIRMQLRSLEFTLRRIGTKKASLIIENYDSPRMMAIIGPEGQETTLYLKSNHFHVPQLDGSKLPLEYTMLVDAGSGTHTSRKVREDQAITLFTLGAIDVLTLLEMLEIPNTAGVFQRVMQMQADQALQDPNNKEKARA